MRPVNLARLAVASAAVLSGAAHAASLREPTGRWVVNYAADECLLSRNYGDEGHPLTLVVEKLPMTDYIGLYLIKRSARQDWNSGKATIITGSRDPTTSSFGAYDVGKSDLRMIGIRVDRGLIADAARNGKISVSIRGEADESFSVPNLDAAFRALDDCALDLGKSWGIPVERQRRIVKPATTVGGLDKIFSPEDYPEIAERNGETGRIKVRVSVDEQGRATSCTLTRSSGSKTLDEATCRILMKRARYAPALDAQGHAVASLYVTTILWLIEG